MFHVFTETTYFWRLADNLRMALRSYGSGQYVDECYEDLEGLAFCTDNMRILEQCEALLCARHQSVYIPEPIDIELIDAERSAVETYVAQIRDLSPDFSPYYFCSGADPATAEARGADFLLTVAGADPATFVIQAKPMKDVVWFSFDTWEWP